MYSLLNGKKYAWADEQDENIRKKVEENGLSASDFLRHPRRKSPARGYEFCENPDNI